MTFKEFLSNFYEEILNNLAKGKIFESYSGENEITVPLITKATPITGTGIKT